VIQFVPRPAERLDAGPGTLSVVPEPIPATLTGAAEAPWANWDAKVAFATRLIASGFLPPAIRTPAQVIAIILTGQELGIPPMQALRQINVISGRPTMSAELMLAKMLKGGVKLKWIKTGEDGKEAVLEGSRATTRFTGHFSLEEARVAGLLTKDGWKKYPAAMLRARVISLVARVVAPDLISGMYIPEEMGAETNADGEIINVATGAAPIAEAAHAPAVVVRGEALGQPRSTAALVEAFGAASTLAEVRALRTEAKATVRDDADLLQLSREWLNAVARCTPTEPAGDL
jgi:hypothetical protein